ncbi:MAG: ATP-binding protein, partial [Varibaculum sp.]
VEAPPDANTTARFLASSALTIEDLCQAITRGGWPQATFLSPADAAATARDYFKAVVNQDISRVDEVNRDEARTRRLMRSYARLQGSQAAIATIQADMHAHEAQTMSPDTINNYLEALRRIFVIEDLPAWSPKLRSKTAIRTSDTRYFTDPSIAAAALEATGKDLAGDPQTLGFLFETLAVRDLRAYTEALGGTVYHYRDKSGLECDTIAHLDDGRYSLIEIKLGGEDAIETGAATLTKLAGLIDTSKMRAPSFLAVLTGVGELAYQRVDGVYVIPIGTLGS